MLTISIANMSGSRNHGSEALVLAKVLEIKKRLKDQVRFLLHSEDSTFDSYAIGAHFDRIFRQYPLLKSRHGYRYGLNKLAYRGLDLVERVLPGGGGRFGTVSAMRKSDLIIVTGGDILTSDYQALSGYAYPLLLGRPTVLLGHTIGPFAPKDEAYFLKATDNVALCTVRESISFDYLSKVAPQLNLQRTADVAFLLPVAGEARVREILETEHRFPIEGDPMIGFSISAGITSFKAGLNRDRYLAEIIRFIDQKNAEGYRFVLIPHVQEKSAHNNDLIACTEVLRKIKQPARNVVLSTLLSAPDFKGVIGQCVALVGARTHATIASMSQGIPTVAIAYSRKAWGIMSDYYGAELSKKLVIDVDSLSFEALTSAFDAAMANGRTMDTASEMRARAAKNFDALEAVVAKIA